MKVTVIYDNKAKKKDYKINVFLEWLIYMLAYAIILLITSNIFRSLYVENFLYGLISAIIIYILNKTLKPVLVTLSLPLIGMSLGLFYFVINVIILLIVDLVLLDHFNLTGIFSPFLVSIFISFMNVIVDNIIIKPLIERCKK